MLPSSLMMHMQNGCDQVSKVKGNVVKMISEEQFIENLLTKNIQTYLQ